MGRLLILVLLMLAGYVGYNYFFGKSEEKAQAKSIVHETKELGKAIGDLLKNKKADYDEGKFDENIQKISDGVEQLKKDPSTSSETIQSLNELEKQLESIDTAYLSNEDRKEIDRVLKMLRSMEAQK